MGQQYGHAVSDPELDSEGRMARTLGGKRTDRVQRHSESKSTVTTTALYTEHIPHMWIASLIMYSDNAMFVTFRIRIHCIYVCMYACMCRPEVGAE